MATLGLPWITFLFVFGGFFAAVAASIAFAVWFKPTDDRWVTVESLRGRRARRTPQR